MYENMSGIKSRNRRLRPLATLDNPRQLYPIKRSSTKYREQFHRSPPGASPGSHLPATVVLVQNVLLGLALISASLQTGWAFFAEGQIAAYPPVVFSLLLGSRYVISEFLRWGFYRI